MQFCFSYGGQSHQRWTVQPALQYIWFFCPFYSTVLLKMLNLLSNCRLFCSQDQVLKYKFQHWYWCIVYILTACQGVSIVKWVDDWPWDQKVSGSGLTASLKIQTHVCMDIPCPEGLNKIWMVVHKNIIIIIIACQVRDCQGSRDWGLTLSTLYDIQAYPFSLHLDNILKPATFSY